MKELYEELELEVIRFKTEDIITTSDATTSDQTPADPTTGGGTNGGTSETGGPIYYGLDGKPVDTPPNFHGYETTVGIDGEGEFPAYKDDDGNFWVRKDDGNYYNTGHPPVL